MRTERGLTFRELAKRVGWSASQFSKMESGDTVGGPEVSQALDTFYGTPDRLLTLWELALADPAQFKEQYRRYMMLEAEAVGLWQYSVSTVPGLVQTEEYVIEALRAGGHDGKALGQQVEARLGRRQLLEGEDAPPFRALLSEAVLRNSLPNAGAWIEQLEYLVEASERPNIVLQVLPFGLGLHGLVNTDTMFLRLLNGRTVAYGENDVRGELVEEYSKVERLQRAYDAVRDTALSPAESHQLVLRMLEEARASRRPWQGDMA